MKYFERFSIIIIIKDAQDIELYQVRLFCLTLIFFHFGFGKRTLRENGIYERMDILDDIDDMGYNVNNKSREGLLYHRENQVVARDIIILRKK